MWKKKTDFLYDSRKVSKQREKKFVFWKFSNHFYGVAVVVCLKVLSAFYEPKIWIFTLKQSEKNQIKKSEAKKKKNIEKSEENK